jgi:hypothetical protein
MELLERNLDTVFTEETNNLTQKSLSMMTILLIVDQMVSLKSSKVRNSYVVLSKFMKKASFIEI